MFYENLTILVGRAIADAELKNVGSTQVASFRLVSNKRIKNKDGTYGEKSCFVDCDAWGKRAEYAANYIKKGKVVRVEAELEQDEWVTDGKKRSKHKLYVNNIQVERDRNSDGDSSGSTQNNAASDAASDDLPF